MSENFFDYDTPASKILDIIKKEKEKLLSDKYEKEAAIQKELRAQLDQKWEKFYSFSTICKKNRFFFLFFVRNHN